MSAHEASFTCSMVSLGASVDPLVLSPVFIMKGKVSARRSTTAVMDPHPAFLPAVPVLVQILVVTEWYLDEMWEDFLALLSLTQNTTIWCMSTRSFHLASHVSGFLGKEINIWKGILSLAHSIRDITQWKYWSSCPICVPSHCIFMLEVCMICGSPSKPVLTKQMHLSSRISE